MCQTAGTKLFGMDKSPEIEPDTIKSENINIHIKDLKKIKINNNNPRAKYKLQISLEKFELNYDQGNFYITICDDDGKNKVYNISKIELITETPIRISTTYKDHSKEKTSKKLNHTKDSRLTFFLKNKKLFYCGKNIIIDNKTNHYNLKKCECYCKLNLKFKGRFLVTYGKGRFLVVTCGKTD